MPCIPLVHSSEACRQFLLLLTGTVSRDVAKVLVPERVPVKNVAFHMCCTTSCTSTPFVLLFLPLFQCSSTSSVGILCTCSQLPVAQLGTGLQCATHCVESGKQLVPVGNQAVLSCSVSGSLVPVPGITGAQVLLNQPFLQLQAKAGHLSACAHVRAAGQQVSSHCTGEDWQTHCSTLLAARVATISMDL
jgi:hypothetical protein